ncbi:hypothetical protein YPPY04_0706, partial [Yersinia pestis PY-04]|jgi:hypothetical protein
MAGP